MTSDPVLPLRGQEAAAVRSYVVRRGAGPSPRQRAAAGDLEPGSERRGALVADREAPARAEAPLHVAVCGSIQPPAHRMCRSGRRVA